MKTQALAACFAALPLLSATAQDTAPDRVEVLASDLLGDRIVRVRFPADPKAAATVETAVGSAAGVTCMAPAPFGLVVCTDLQHGRLVLRGPETGARDLAVGLERPRSVRALPNQHLLVADSSCGKVTEFDAEHLEVWSFGDDIAPWDAYRSDDGHTMIADRVSRGLLEVDDAGTVIWSRPNLGDITRVRPLDSGNLLVVLTDAGEVVELGRDGRIVAKLAGLSRPMDALRTADDRTIVAVQGAVREFDSEGRPRRAATVGLPTSLLQVAAEPTALSGEAGYTWIADYSDNRIFALDRDGREVVRLEDVYGAWDVDPLPNGNLLITEFALNRVSEMTRGGEIVWSYEDLRNPYDADRLPNGNTLIADTFGQRVVEVTPLGDVVWEFEGVKPFDCDRLPNGNTLIADGDRDRILEVTPEGTVAWEQNGFASVHDADRLPNGNTLITQRTLHRAVEITPEGKIVWELPKLSSPSDADRLPNGDTIVAENGQVRTFDRDGKLLRKIETSWAVEVNVVLPSLTGTGGR